MATPADQRLLELLDKWLKSLELHLKYCSLDDVSYAQIQPWPAHQRPSRWILDLAKQKAAALRDQVQERVNRGDAQFSDSLELMSFLANLVGAEHIERFIPLANPDAERDASPRPPEARARSAPSDSTGTREMPAFLVGKQRASPPARTDQVARTERKSPDANPPAKTVTKPPSKAAGPISSDAMRELVIADAARLVQWGRKWYELAELISSMADRPSLTDVRRILKDNKTVIDEKAGRS